MRQLPRPAAGDEPAVIHRPARRHAVGHGFVMRGNDQGDVGAFQVVEHGVEETQRRSAVQLPGRLIGKHKLRTHGQSARHGNTLGLAAGQFLRQLVAEFAKTERLQKRCRDIIGADILAGQQHGQADILDSGKGGKQAGRLEYEADLARPQGFE